MEITGGRLGVFEPPKRLRLDDVEGEEDVDVETGERVDGPKPGELGTDEDGILLLPDKEKEPSGEERE